MLVERVTSGEGDSAIEQLLLAALSQCHMLSYLHVAVKHGVVVTDYRDEASGLLKLNRDGSGQFESVTLRPRVTLAAPVRQLIRDMDPNLPVAEVRTLENVVCATGGASLEKMPGGVAWKQKYDRQYPGRFQVYSPYTYDATFVLVDAMKRANSWDPKVYTPELIKTNYKGVTTTIQFEPNGELKNAAITLYVYKDGKKVALD